MARLLKRCVDLNSRNLKVDIPEVCKTYAYFSSADAIAARTGPIESTDLKYKKIGLDWWFFGCWYKYRFECLKY